MQFTRHWRKILLLAIVAIIALTAQSIIHMEEYVRHSFVFWIYMVAPLAAHTVGGVFVWVGVGIMKFNDSLFGTTFQLGWFLRLNVVVGCLTLLLGFLQALEMYSGGMPVLFAFGSGILWVACCLIHNIGEQDAPSNGG